MNGQVDTDQAIEDAADAWAAAVDDDERAEAIEELMEQWYAAWPETAVTSPHAPLAAAIVRLTGTARPEYAPVVTIDGQLWRCTGCGAQKATATGESPDWCERCPAATWQKLYTVATP